MLPARSRVAGGASRAKRPGGINVGVFAVQARIVAGGREVPEQQWHWHRGEHQSRAEWVDESCSVAVTYVSVALARTGSVSVQGRHARTAR